MPEGGWLHDTLQEAWRDYTLLLIVGLAIAAAVRSRASRSTRSRASMRGTTFFLFLHIATLPLLGYLAAGGYQSYDSWRLFSISLATMAGVTILLGILFDGILRGLRFEAPRLMQDMVAAGAYVVAFLVLLSAWGVNLGGLIATSAVLTAVIGFSLQDTLGNLMGGMALQMERSVRPGDWVKVGDVVGKVLEVRWRQTTLETRNWETVIVPNSVMSKNQFMVLGRRLGQPLQLRRSMEFNTDYRFQPAEVIRTVEEALRRAPIQSVAAEPLPDCVLMDMRGSFYTFRVRYYLTDLNRDDPIDSLVRNRIDTALRRADIPLTMPAHAVFLTSDSEERRERKERDRDRTREDAMRRAQLFARLSESELRQLADGLRFSPFSAGEVMTRQGTEGHDLYLIHQGKVGVRIHAGGVETEVAELGPGDFFGERSLMTGEMRSATTVALTDVVCYRLPKAELQEVLKSRPELADELAEILARRENELDARRQHLNADARENRVESDRRRLVSQIRNFFGL
ncbi:MAG TPA: mechanosensitive ion channel family protein [Kofleriaceae bacterium]|jgi:small-conductance mechanosensitive channel/CRP-like cAMP-binding protein